MATPVSPMKLYIPSTSKADGPVTERQLVQDGSGFTFIFQMPFKRADIFAELMSEKQLGVDHANIKMKITLPGKVESARLQKQLGEGASVEDHLKKMSLGSNGIKYEVGCQRTVYFPDGEVVSELIDLAESERIQWKQLSSKRDTNMVGLDDKLPIVTIALEDAEDGLGTTVKMTYDFYQIIAKDGSQVEGPTMTKMLSMATAGWKDDMVSRGYEIIAGADAGGSPSSRVVRSNMKNDMDEEARMKAEMMARAQGKK